jgi:hypothetical protein
MLQDKRAKEEEEKGGQQAELSKPGKGGSRWVRGRRDARLVAVALPEALAGVSP